MSGPGFTVTTRKIAARASGAPTGCAIPLVALNVTGAVLESDAIVVILAGPEESPSSETCGILGRVYKDQWGNATKSGNALLAKGYLDKAIKMYL